jgi:hypothetical protein
MSNDLTATTGSNGVATTTAASNRIAERRRLTAAAVMFFSIRESEMELAHGLVDTELDHRWPDIIRRRIDRGEAILAAHRSAIGDLRAALVPVTQKDIAVEVTDLMLAFPCRDDLAEFTSLLFDHILVEHPSRFVLAAACHRLRCTSKFRPAISEVLEKLAEVASRFRGIEPFANLEENLDKARAYLAEMEAKPIRDPQPEVRSGLQTPRADWLRQQNLKRQEEEEAAATALVEAERNAENERAIHENRTTRLRAASDRR